MTDHQNPYASPEADAGEAPVPSPNEGVVSRELYRSTRSIGRLLRTAFAIMLALSVLSIGAGAWYIATAADSWDQEDLSPAELAELFVALALLVTYLVTVIIFCKWKYRSYRNAMAFGSPGLRFTPGWAVGYYFVPIANLFQPYKAMKDVYNGSRGDHVEQRAATVASWWAGFLVMGFLDRAATRIGLRAETLEALQAATVVEIAASVATVIASLLAIRLVKRVDERQLRRSVSLGWENEEQHLFRVE